METPDQPHTEREAALMMELAAEKRENAQFRERIIPDSNNLIQELTDRLSWLKASCRVVYYPKDGSYPIEHAPGAGKDQWDAILTAKNR